MKCFDNAKLIGKKGAQKRMNDSKKKNGHIIN